MRFSILTHFLLSTLVLSVCQRTVLGIPKIYVVYLGSHHNGEYDSFTDPESVTNSHHDMLSFVSRDAEPAKKLIYSYNKVFNGFAASLHEEEAEELKKHPDVISVFENEHGSPQTSRSWEFLGLEGTKESNKNTFEHHTLNTRNMKGEEIWEKARFGEDFIVACLDSGIWPESKSFSDEGYGPIPKKFKGACENENDPKFKCNRKLIGARYYHKGYEHALASVNLSAPNETLSPRDPYIETAHGTHVASIAAGNFVPGIDMFGLAHGTVKGGLPRARVAMYKVCWMPAQGSLGGCSGVDILAAFEDAINDGVDIINLSLVVYSQSFFRDFIALGAYHAMRHGILVVGCAGNDGPMPGSVFNVAPWVLTVGSSSIDRSFENEVILGNNKHILAGSQSVDSNHTDKVYPLITGIDARLVGANITKASYCMPGTVDPVKVKGKLLVCDQNSRNGRDLMDPHVATIAAGVIFANKKPRGYATTLEYSRYLASRLSYVDAQTLFAYMNSTRSPVASLTKPVTKLGTKPNPFMSTGSSRGPNLNAFDILKPDVRAPGRQIIAAFLDMYGLLGGTSMSAPHVTGIAGLIKILHPDWTTSAIKSAIMTTATPLDNRGKNIHEEDLITEATPFAYGSGHVQPVLAVDPGLVYDMDHRDYLNFLCALPYFNQTLITKFTAEAFKCHNSKDCMRNFNYPSITVSHFSGKAKVTRKLKNVGQPGKYTARVEPTPGISIIVEPKTLTFTTKGQVLEYKLTFTADDTNKLSTDYTFGGLVWSDGKHFVRSPIVVIPKGLIETDFEGAPQLSKP